MTCHATRVGAAIANIGLVGFTNISTGCCVNCLVGSMNLRRDFAIESRWKQSISITATNGRGFLARFSGFLSAKFSSASMKAKIIITPKKAVLDPQGKTVQTALEHMGYTGVTGVHIGKYIEIDLAPGTDKAAAEKALNDAAHKLLSNPVIEDYKLEIE